MGVHRLRALLFVTAAAASEPALRQRRVAQAPAPVDQSPRFEVASIEPHQANDDVMFGLQYGRGGLFTATGSLQMLMRTAYRLQEFQVLGGPDWMTSELFDIVARTSAGTTPDTMRLMLQALLNERFGLRVRTEIRERPVYGLALAGRDFVSRPAFRPAAVDCEGHCAQQPLAAPRQTLG